MNPGKLDDLLQVQVRTKARDAFGRTNSWANQGDPTPAHVLQVEESTRLRYAQRDTVVTHTITFRQPLRIKMRGYQFVWLNKPGQPILKPVDTFYDGGTRLNPMVKINVEQLEQSVP